MENRGPDDPVAMYIREASNVEPLAKDEETKLFRELAGPGDWDDARQNVARRLIEAHLAQVVSIAQKHSASGTPMLDLIQEGNIGLMNAVRRFAESPIGDFTDYATTCIDDAIKKAFGLLTVAVGTTIADRPPRGSARALISACGSYRG